MCEATVTCEELGKEPRIWLRRPGYVIRNYSPDLEESVVQHMFKITLKEEPLNSSSGFEEDPVSMKELDSSYREILKENITLIAQTDNGPGADLKPVTGIVPLAGVNILSLGYRDKPFPPLEEMFFGVATLKSFGTYVKYSTFNFYEHFNIDKILEALGLGVHPDHRGRGLGQALIETREPLCRALGVRATQTIFTTAPAQKIALRCGFKTFLTVKYGDIMNEQGERDFPNLPAEDTMIVSAKYYDF